MSSSPLRCLHPLRAIPSSAAAVPDPPALRRHMAEEFGALTARYAETPP